MIHAKQFFMILSIVLVAASGSLAGDTKGKQPIKIELVVEEIDGASAYQFAAAEVVRTQFAQEFKIVPGDTEAIELYVMGTNISRGCGCQYLDVRLKKWVSTWVGNRPVMRPVQLEAFGTMLCGYTEEQRAQSVKEYTYKVLSKFLETLSSSPEEGKP